MKCVMTSFVDGQWSGCSLISVYMGAAT